jgi:RNA polymerase sigma factor (sigma-70 family)
MSALLRQFGTERIDSLESATQEAFIKAIQLWPLKGRPENPLNWLIKVAHNAALDEMRDSKRNVPITNELDLGVSEERKYFLPNELNDDELRMFFLCCHPVLSIESQVAFLLKTACGFSVTEIARAFLTKEETIAQRLVRAKQKLREEQIEFGLPPANELSNRLDPVAMSLYLLFNEGYGASEGENLVRDELCDEAIHLTRELIRHPLGQDSKIYALMALMLFHRARINTRTDSLGNILLLRDQDRNLWDRKLIMEAAKFLALSMKEDRMSKYHLEAGIAAGHALAPSWEETNWSQILSYYELLEKISPSPVVTLNRIAVHLAKDGPERALQGLTMFEKSFKDLEYYMYPSIAAEIHFQLGDKNKAKVFFSSALKLARTKSERTFLEKKLRLLGS